MLTFTIYENSETICVQCKCMITVSKQFYIQYVSTKILHLDNINVEPFQNNNLPD